MRLLMAISADGFVAKDEYDDMSWLGPNDKKIFRFLTGIDGVCCVGRKTAPFMPELPGRKVYVLSKSNDDTLHDFYFNEPDAWLLGGQTLALEAFEQGFIQEVHLCRSSINIQEGILEELSPWIEKDFDFIMKTSLANVTHEVYRKK